jgi:hypothetical protein
MARTDPPIFVNVPQFVHDDLDVLIHELEAEDAGKTNLVGALIHQATIVSARRALKRYKVDEVAFRRESETTSP